MDRRNFYDVTHDTFQRFQPDSNFQHSLKLAYKNKQPLVSQQFVATLPSLAGTMQDLNVHLSVQYLPTINREILKNVPLKQKLEFVLFNNNLQSSYKIHRIIT